MSTQAAQDFIKNVQSDDGLKKQIAQASDVNAVVTIGAASGFEFTAEEFREATSGDWGNSATELNESDLEGVAGGYSDGANWTSQVNATNGDCYTLSCDGTTTTTKGGGKNK